MSILRAHRGHPANRHGRPAKLIMINVHVHDSDVTHRSRTSETLCVCGCIW